MIQVAKAKLSQTRASVSVTFKADFHPKGTVAALGDLVPGLAPNVEVYLDDNTWSKDPVTFTAADLASLKAGHPVTIRVSGRGSLVASPLSLQYVFTYAAPADQNGVRRKHVIRGRISHRSL